MASTLTRPPAAAFGGPPPEDDHDGGGGGSGWVELTRARNDIHAHLVAGRLAAAGIEARVLKDRSVSAAWLYGGANPWAPAVLLVRSTQLFDARVALAEVAYEAPAARLAPTGVERDWKTPVLWWSLALGLGILMTGLALARTPAALKRCDLPLVCGDRVMER